MSAVFLNEIQQAQSVECFDRHSQSVCVLNPKYVAKLQRVERKSHDPITGLITPLVCLKLLLLPPRAQVPTVINSRWQNEPSPNAFVVSVNRIPALLSFFCSFSANIGKFSHSNLFYFCLFSFIDHLTSSGSRGSRGRCDSGPTGGLCVFRS